MLRAKSSKVIPKPTKGPSMLNEMISTVEKEKDYI